MTKAEETRLQNLMDRQRLGMQMKPLDTLFLKKLTAKKKAAALEVAPVLISADIPDAAWRS
jgi:hypothetical protein